MGSALAFPTGDALLALISQAGSSLRTRLSLVEYIHCLLYAQAEGRPTTASMIEIRERVTVLGADIDKLWSGYEPDIDSSNYVFEKREKFQRGLHALLMETASICEDGKFLDTKYMQQAGMRSPAQARAASGGAGND